jgi:hypothetical protein
MTRLFRLALALAAILPTAVLAQDRDTARYRPERPSHWSFELGAGTDNRSKGASKSDGAPYVLGDVQWNAASGFYADLEFLVAARKFISVTTLEVASQTFSG